MKHRILLVGGGSGGHIYPLVAINEALHRKAAGLGLQIETLILGQGNFLERAAKENNIPFKKMAAGKLRRYPSLDAPVDLIKILIGFLQSFWHLFWFMPDAVFVKGGYASFQPALAARLFFIPVFIHESDSVSGLTNTIIGKIAKKVFLSFKTAEKNFRPSKSILAGNPVRLGLAKMDKETARAYFNFTLDKPVILVIGGSQGAAVLNGAVLDGLVNLTEKFNIIHQCGDKNYQNAEAEVNKILNGVEQYAGRISRSYKLYQFLDEKHLAMAYILADVIVARAGSGLLFEIAQAGKPAIIVPIRQSANNHQYRNALEFASYGGYLIEENNLSLESLTRQLNFILEPENYVRISEKIKTFARPDAANIIAQEIMASIMQ